MSHSTHDDHITPEEFQSYVEDIVIETLRDGAIPPAALLECIYYLVEPDLLTGLRALAALSPAERLMVTNYARTLYDERTAY